MHDWYRLALLVAATFGCAGLALVVLMRTKPEGRPMTAPHRPGTDLQIWTPQAKHRAPTQELTEPVDRAEPVEPSARPEPQAHRFELDEPRLPEQVVVRCDWHSSYFAGWSGVPEYPARLTVRGAVLRGGSHEATESSGQDVVGAAWDPATGALYVAVADGLGSLSMSGAVAHQAVQAAFHLSLTRPRNLTFHEAGPRFFAAIADGLRRSFGPGAESEGGTTLVVAEIVPMDDDVNVTVHAVGDSEAWQLKEKGWLPVHHERNAPGAEDNATRDLPNDPNPRPYQFRCARGSALLLATDGFAGALGPGSALERHLNRSWRRPPSPIEFVNVINQTGGSYSDDRGVVGVWIG
jgi:hypothetical protein